MCENSHVDHLNVAVPLALFRSRFLWPDYQYSRCRQLFPTCSRKGAPFLALPLDEGPSLFVLAVCPSGAVSEIRDPGPRIVASTIFIPLGSKT